ncbi:kinase-like domain-containing protein [Crepidotus variabilis]|uniref:non-specific serine/threonine protein kinase n=1 Tax=Crepidotus variabilis TaxID=179855 RepID=A0A9P6JKL7_9AGAR|nr:kinase-like domain-containing protein [Crepidotus variabilis]
MNSGIWMAFDHKANMSQLRSALTSYTTNLAERRLIWELEALQRVNEDQPFEELNTRHLPKLYDFFRHVGVGADGDHLCLVMALLGGDVQTLLRHTEGGRLPLSVVKKICIHTLRGLAHLHSCDIAHTDLKRDNIMLDLGSASQADVTSIIQADPPRRPPPEENWKCIVQAAVSQLLPLPSTLESLLERDYVVADLGSGEHYWQFVFAIEFKPVAQDLKAKTADYIMPEGMKASEVILQGESDERLISGLWVFLLTGRPLYVHETKPVFPELDANGCHLWQISSFSREKSRRTFEPVTLSAFAAVLRKYDVFSKDGLVEVAMIMQFNPRKRPSAADLLTVEW